MLGDRPDPEDSGLRSLRHRLREWVLLDGSRLRVMVATDLVILGLLTAVSLSPLTPYDDLQAQYLVFSRMIGGNITIVSIVVVINQLLISRELHTPDELRSQMEGVLEYRHNVEELAGGIPPAEPVGLLDFLNEGTKEQVRRLADLLEGPDGDAIGDELSPIVADLRDRADAMDDLLSSSDVSTFDVLRTTLSTEHPRQMTELRRIKRRHADDLSAEAGDAIDDLVRLLQDIEVARQYFKTVYLREELAALSRLLFYVGLVSLTLVSVGMMLFTGSPTATTLDPYVPYLIPLVIVIGLLPISLLFAYVLRVATVTKRTAETLPFTTPDEAD